MWNNVQTLLKLTPHCEFGVVESLKSVDVTQNINKKRNKRDIEAWKFRWEQKIFGCEFFFVCVFYFTKLRKTIHLADYSTGSKSEITKGHKLVVMWMRAILNMVTVNIMQQMWTKCGFTLMRGKSGYNLICKQCLISMTIMQHYKTKRVDIGMQ